MTELIPPHPITLDVHFPVQIRVAVQDDLPKLEMDGQFIRFRNLFRRAYREQQTGRRMMLVADCNDAIVGRLFILFGSSDHTIADGRNRAYLYSFFVMTPFRGQGIGTQMVEYAESVLQQRNFHYVTIAVAKDNPGALRLYERMDYIKKREDAGRWSYTDHQGRIHRVNEPCWILEKTL
jgi:ribosomal protein S18 acetylase RimI-like enzyme